MSLITNTWYSGRSTSPETHADAIESIDDVDSCECCWGCNLYDCMLGLAVSERAHQSAGATATAGGTTSATAGAAASAGQAG